MKPFNIFVILILAIITIGFIFFKDMFNLPQNKTESESSNNPILMDRINYLDYTKESLNSSKGSGRSVLFFAATTWCQTCSQLDKEIKENAQRLPSDVTILKVDYDNDREMKRAWGITIQHTLIVLDKDGKEIKRWVGGNFDLLLRELS
ncbi:MAG: thioredoxin family protein [Candidatus Levybacteria bacterium]|nr:thioredoxin family protein [Candidatus Levybacteria bacterium]